MANYEEIINYQSHTSVGGVLKNKLGITNQEELDRAERVITSYRLAQLYLAENNIEFRVDYYLKIHAYLFKDIYPFAGQIRDETIEKQIPFCLPHLIYPNLKDVLNKAEILSKKIKNLDDLIDAVTYIYSELDIIHPFREGNGRTEREFIRQYVNYINQYIDFGHYNLDYSVIENEKDNFINAVIEADATCDLALLREYMKKIIISENVMRK